ncbi:endonuclease/exonuclease/phosphatase family protein [Candidatus Regiella endosymbiont of Tuberolachnus salignus]|uniref:endonuclease/exonuclease/phosphatase family protein n=1 Tax=Candidatus Regiella endosymbiont of Tuberolachnus salignus TaxID=3077956 RepID=UPI0030CD023B
MPKRTHAMRYVAGKPVEQIFSSSAYFPRQGLPLCAPLQASKFLRVVVWNIFKQQRVSWLAVLKKFGKDSQLMLLQEARTTPEMVRFATSHYLTTDQVPAFTLPHHPSGVMTLAAAHPIYCCPLREREPLLRLSKSALVTVYPIQDGRSLMVVNIHAVNFSVGVNVYSKQFSSIGAKIALHRGPLILAGDFNAWNRQRVNALRLFTRSMELQEVEFFIDNRSRVFGFPLDFIFFRDLYVAEASVLVTRASDHNPLRVDFLL